jgi:hypothetical protein
MREDNGPGHPDFSFQESMYGCFIVFGDRDLLAGNASGKNTKSVEAF